MMGHWAFAALFFPALQVAPLYLWAHQPRAHTIYRRMIATALVAAAAGWLPTRQLLAASGGGAGGGTQALLVALGIRSDGLAAACMLPLALTTLLFAGPLVQLVVGGRPEWQRRTALPPAAALRNWLAAPLVEEFVFRACLISFLLTAGARPAAVVWLSPLLFGAAHLHHAWELCRHKGQARGAAARAVAFQLCYSTVFGWLAALLFVRTRHLAAAVLPHAFCNFMGPPAPPAAEERHARLIAAAYAGGIVAFLALLAPLTRPALFAIDLS